MKTYWHRRANISIGTVTTLPAGSEATASVDEDNVLSLGIPTGEQGLQGAEGPAMTYDDMTPADKQALARDVVSGLPYAGSSVGGVVKVGSGLTIDANGVLSASGSASPPMSGASASSSGSGGTVPAPLAGDQVKYLRGDATWASPPIPGAATTDAAGLMSAADKTKLDNIAAQATKGTRTQLYYDGNPQPANSYLAWCSGDVVQYDFIIIKFLCRNGYDQQLFQVFVPQSDGSTTYRIKSCLQFNGFENNKNGSRKFTASYNSTGNQTSFVFDNGYFDGQANTGVCIPMNIWGIKL